MLDAPLQWKMIDKKIETTASRRKIVRITSTDSLIRFQCNYNGPYATAIASAKRRLNQVQAIIETYHYDSMDFSIQFHFPFHSVHLLVAARNPHRRRRPRHPHPLVCTFCFPFVAMCARCSTIEQETFLYRVNTTCAMCRETDGYRRRLVGPARIAYRERFLQTQRIRATYHSVSAIPITLLKVYSN